MTSYCVFETRFGWAGIAGTDGRLSRVVLPKESREEAVKGLNAGLAERAVEDENAFDGLPERLTGYLEGDRVDLGDVVVDLDALPPFARRALLECKKVPYGTVVTYAEIARRAGSERACRAAGNAMASNPVPIIVPCHRVTASDGGLGGFSAGLDWKRRLLKLEGVEI
jgi:methylated-DNA-[protein]-cysteine S-methyltransferase